MVVANGQKATILDSWVLSLHQISVFWVKKLMSMMAQLYDDFFTEFIYPNNQRLQRFSGKFQFVKKRQVFFTFADSSSNGINAGYIRLYASYDEARKVKIVVFCPFATTDPYRLSEAHIWLCMPLQHPKRGFSS